MTEKTIILIKATRYRKGCILEAKGDGPLFTCKLFVPNSSMSSHIGRATLDDLKKACFVPVDPTSIPFVVKEDFTHIEPVTFCGSSEYRHPGLRWEWEDKGAEVVFGDYVDEINSLLANEINAVARHTDIAEICVPTLWHYYQSDLFDWWENGTVKDKRSWELIGVVDMNNISIT